jgi:catechol 2,3-dioxygenase-like lactoylglutathione lyase family enzyme
MQIDHVELFVPDRQEAARWYRDVLGLEILEGYRAWFDDPRGPLMISSDGGTTKLALFTGDPQGERPTSGFHLVAFRVDAVGFVAFLDRLPILRLRDHRARDVTRELAVDHDKAFSLYFSDPWGHRLELTTYEHDAVRGALRS